MKSMSFLVSLDVPDFITRPMMAELVREFIQDALNSCPDYGLYEDVPVSTLRVRIATDLELKKTLRLRKEAKADA